MLSKTNKQLLPYAIVVLLGYIGFSLPLPILPEMFLDPQHSILPLSFSLKQKMRTLGILMTAYPIGQLFGCPILGQFSDRFGRRKIILMSLCGNALGYVLTALAVQEHSVLGIFSGLLLCGFSEGNVAIAQAVIGDTTPAENKAQHFGWLNFFSCSGFIIGPLLGGMLGNPKSTLFGKQIFSFATPFWLAAFLTFAAMAVVYFYSKETRVAKNTQQHFFASLRVSLEHPRMRRYFLANFFLYLGLFSLWRFLPVFLERHFSFTPSEIAYTMAYQSFAYALTLLLLIKGVAKRLSPRMAVSLFSAALGLMLGIVVIPSSGYSLLWTIPIIGSCVALVMTNSAVMVSNAAEADLQGQTMGNLQAVQVLAEVVVGIGGGLIAASHTALPLYMGGVMALCCTGLLFRRKRDV